MRAVARLKIRDQARGENNVPYDRSLADEVERKVSAMFCHVQKPLIEELRGIKTLFISEYSVDSHALQAPFGDEKFNEIIGGLSPEQRQEFGVGFDLRPQYRKYYRILWVEVIRGLKRELEEDAEDAQLSER
ncbi:MAG: hypothetical protein KGI79_03355 [Patescibacteria group bacterium]|nr:hypothetical protein [Patescibacteria group bacterium]MDE2116884.1 hypothetical protein [Patescibacteria group bacterium]